MNWGFSIETAEDGKEALSILEGDNAPPLAILDWMMPKMDGVEVCERVREHPNRPYVYLVLLTAKSKTEEIAEGLEAGADDYLIKPFDMVELRARLSVGQRTVGMQRNLTHKVSNLESELGGVSLLKEILPICMYCKSVREDGTYRRAVDEYIRQEAGMEFSYGICPDCMANLQTTAIMGGVTGSRAGCNRSALAFSQCHGHDSEALCLEV